MTRSMKDFIETRTAEGTADVRIDVPVLLPGYSAIGKFSANPDQRGAGLLATVYAIPNQLFRIIKRSIDKSRNPNQSVHSAAKLRNFEVVITGTEVSFCPASPLLSKALPAVWTAPLAETTVQFETVTDDMSKLTIDGDQWHVHPEYVGDVRWALRRIADESPGYDITFESPGDPR